jgi:LysR family cyn operon transcriptional activator
MELRHIRYFVRAAEMLHFTHAAESLYISQPTLSTHIHEVEEEVGLPLFNRAGRKVCLTEAGEIFLEHSLRILRGLELAQEQVADLEGVVSGTLRLGALLGFGQTLLPSWMAGFHSRYPRIRFDVMTGSSDFIEAELLAAKLDLGLSFVPAAGANIDSELLFSEELYLVVSQQHPLAGRDQIEIEELSSLPLALVSRRFAIRARYDSFLAQRNVSLNVLVEIDDLRALLKLASEGNLGTLLSPLSVDNYPQVRLISVAGMPPIRHGMLRRADGHLSPPAKAFYEYIKEECSALPKPLHSAEWDKS